MPYLRHKPFENQSTSLPLYIRQKIFILQKQSSLLTMYSLKRCQSFSLSMTKRNLLQFTDSFSFVYRIQALAQMIQTWGVDKRGRQLCRAQRYVGMCNSYISYISMVRARTKVCSQGLVCLVRASTRSVVEVRARTIELYKPCLHVERARYVRLNSLNVPHVPRPRIDAPQTWTNRPERLLWSLKSTPAPLHNSILCSKHGRMRSL